MPPRPRAVDLGARRGEAAVQEIAREIDDARRQHAISLAALGSAAGMSRWRAGRAAAGKDADLTIVEASRLLAVVGLRLSIRAYPEGDPIRDDAHRRLLSALRSRLHTTLSLQTEVPLPGGDRRAWDAVIRGQGWSLGLEAETRVRDLQALERRIAAKTRDGGLDRVLLVLADTRHHRSILSLWPEVRTRFPLPGERALELLQAGVDPGGDAVVMLPVRGADAVPRGRRGSKTRRDGARRGAG